MGIAKPLNAIKCTHYNYSNLSMTYPDIDAIVVNAYSVVIIGVDGSIYPDAASFKNYLAAQYAAGTPVTIVYELITPIEYDIDLPKIISNNGMTTIFSDIGNIEVTGPTRYNYDSLISTANSNIDILNILTDESNFRSSATLMAFNNGFDYLCIESLEDTDGIDLGANDGQFVVTNYYDPSLRNIEKTSSDTVTIQSNTFSLDTVPYTAWISLDYEGTGTVTPYFSKNNGTSWTGLTNNSLVSVGVSLTKNIRIKLVLSGIVTLKNIAWGCK